MNPVSIAQWLIDNPGQWIRVAEEVASRDEDYARQIGVAFEEMAWNYTAWAPEDSLDGDHASGLASAGWGTDEDYGG